ncbi:hypothetical protein [Solirubrobacter soli]|uniref:hypothetical protein n=1 Tax=Solirubrobacter soli TaxID=363832 RepID=UPI0004130136|nr:hypothetical protein [Solirubrobacter soli]
MKKSKRTSSKRRPAFQPDESRPTKPDARVEAPAAEHIPSYEGQSKTAVAAAPEGASRVKAPFKAQGPDAAGGELRLGDQQAKGSGGDQGAAGQDEQYIRMRVRVREGELSIVDSHLVSGPLGQVTGFPAGNAYEVTLDDRLLHAGALPDLGLQRSFPNPEGPPEQHGHHFAERGVYDFMARVPAAEVTPETLDRIVVRLHRVKEATSAEQLSAPMAVQFARQVRPVGELSGLPGSVLPEAIERRGGRTPDA